MLLQELVSRDRDLITGTKMWKEGGEHQEREETRSDPAILGPKQPQHQKSPGRGHDLTEPPSNF